MITVLDTSAVSALADRRSSARRRLQAALTAAQRVDARVIVPSAVLIEAYGSARADATIDAALARLRAPVLSTGRRVARQAGALLRRYRLDSCHAVDATVVASAIRLGGALIVTSDPDDLRRLASRHPNVEVRPL